MKQRPVSLPLAGTIFFFPRYFSPMSYDRPAMGGKEICLGVGINPPMQACCMIGITNVLLTTPKLQSSQFGF